jgi:hypothetical protein
MYTATNRDDAEAFRMDRGVVSTALSVQLRRWLAEAWAGREQQRIERLVCEIGHPAVIAEMRRARARRDVYAAWS